MKQKRDEKKVEEFKRKGAFYYFDEDMNLRFAGADCDKIFVQTDGTLICDACFIGKVKKIWRFADVCDDLEKFLTMIQSALDLGATLKSVRNIAVSAGVPKEKIFEIITKK